MSPGRNPTPRQLSVLKQVAEAGGSTPEALDPEAADDCLLWGWLEPQGAHGFRLTESGRAFLTGAPAPRL